MGFKRAQWHSGLTYENTCEECHTKIRYMDDKLDFRPWFADGFVYCPVCQKPLRHNENLAINAPAANEPPKTFDFTVQNVEDSNPNTSGAFFCSNCGNQFGANDRFCSICGAKR